MGFFWATTAQAAEKYQVSERHIRNLCAKRQNEEFDLAPGEPFECMRLGKLWRVLIKEEEPQRETAATTQGVGESTREDFTTWTTKDG